MPAKRQLWKRHRLDRLVPLRTASQLFCTSHKKARHFEAEMVEVRMARHVEERLRPVGAA